MKILSTIGLLTLAGCSTQQLYNVAQGWQHQECQRIADRDGLTDPLGPADEVQVFQALTGG